MYSFKELDLIFSGIPSERSKLNMILKVQRINSKIELKRWNKARKTL